MGRPGRPKANPKTYIDAPKLTASQLREKVTYLEERNKKLEESAYCYMCAKFKPKTQFYDSTDPAIKSHKCPICKKCAADIALRLDANGEYHSPTKDSIIEALRYLDKPFFTTVYNASITEASNGLTGNNNIWYAYIKNISMVNYRGMTFMDSEMFKGDRIIYDDEKTIDDVIGERIGMNNYTDYLKNKKDVIRLLGYDPYEKEAITDQPLLYAQLVGMLDSDEDGNQDMLRVESIISIVRSFLQKTKIEEATSALMGDYGSIQRNATTIRALQESSQRIASTITDLAKESCISMKNSRDGRKGENTWTGKLRKIAEINIRDSEVNGYDLATCKGMQQVANISMEAILRGLKLEENEWADMVAEQRKIIASLTSKLDGYEEAFRLVLRENLDMRDVMKKNNIIDQVNFVPLENIISTYIVNSDNKQVKALPVGDKDGASDG